jgi:hypothetical protein
MHEVNRLQRVLEDAGIKLAGVASNILGVLGRAMPAALVRGNTDPVVVADLASGYARRVRRSDRRWRDTSVPRHAFMVRGI